MRSLRGCLLAAVSIAFGCATGSHPAHIDRIPETNQIVATPIDAVGGQIVVAAFQETVTAYGIAERTAMREPVVWTIESGQATISRDPFTGNTIFTPLGNDPVIARPHIGSRVGPAVAVGMRPDLLPPDQQIFQVTGGGSCRANPNHFMEASQLDVRSVVNASVIPISKTERVLRYVTNGEYYTHDAKAGSIRLRYNPGYTSEVRLHSLSPDGSQFFPASVETKLFFEIEILDTGMRLFNKKPLVLRKASTDWPPFKDPLLSDTPVDFYDEQNPETVVLTINSQEAYLYPTKELDVHRKSFSIDNGVLNATYEIRNLTETAADIRWFFIGNLGQPTTPTDGVAKMPPGGTVDVKLQTMASKAAVQQFLTLAAVTESGTRLSGFERMEFRFPETTPTPNSR